MTKQEFLDRLAKKIPKDEREERLAFYSEMIDDRMEEGMTEAESVASIDPEIPPEEKPATKRKMKAGVILLLVLGSPIWLPLLISLFAVALSLYISLWAVIIALWSVFASLTVCGVTGVIGGAGLAICGLVPAGLVMVGMGLVSSGLAIGFFYGCHWVTKGTAELTKKLVSRKGKTE